MVHALKEAHRVLKPDGILVDLRPAAVHRRLGLGEGRRWQPIGALHEVLDDDHAADAAIARVLRDGYFHSEARRAFLLDRVMDTLEDIREWLEDFDQRRTLPSHAPLLQRLERRMRRMSKPIKIVVRGRMTLGVLRKIDRPE
jgi:SAM-dependent methyltransferase